MLTIPGCKFLIKFFLWTFTVGVPFSVSAQKLPNVQTVSLRAPAGAKIDGKANDWGDKFQAYNKTTQVYYAMANDDDRLYLIIRTANPNIIEKIVKAGITLTVSASQTKKDKPGVIITFPARERKDPNFGLILTNAPAPVNDTIKNRMQAYSFIHAKNVQLREHLKWIGVKGIQSITDTLISVYNEEGIKAAFLLDKTLSFTCELAVPLKYFNFPANTPLTVAYNIRLNSVAATGTNFREIRDGVYVWTGADGNNYTAGTGSDAFERIFTTDFWGEYTIAKKP